MIFCWFVAGHIFDVERVVSIMEEIVLEMHKQLVSPHQEQNTSIGHVCDVATEMFQQFKVILHTSTNRHSQYYSFLKDLFMNCNLVNALLKNFST